MTKTDHLAAAKEAARIAESDDSKREAWLTTQRELRAADAAGATQREAAAYMGRAQSWVRSVLNWDPSSAPTPFSEAADTRTTTRYERQVPKIAREQPDVIAEAIAKAPPDAQRRIASQLVNSPLTEDSLRDLATPKERKPRTPKSTEEKLNDATFTLWEVGELLQDAVPSGEAKIRMLASAEKAQRLAAGIVHLLDTGEFEDEFRALIAEVGAES